jgi:molybdopterin-dependent oxidoreductase alpha subunit
MPWASALERLGETHRDTDPARIAWYLTSRGLTNETYYAAGKAARALGIANIDSAARVCHSPSSVGLMATLGVAAATCSLQDVLDTEVIVLWGTNPANNQPVFMKYLDKAVKSGTTVVVINPYLEPGLERYWVPSKVESYLFGTKVAGLHVQVRPGGDIAFSNAVMKALVERELLDLDFLEAHTEGSAALFEYLDGESLEDLLRDAGVPREQFEAFMDLYGKSQNAVFIWSMGITQHQDGAAGVQAIVNVALGRGNVGRNGAGLMPIRGHSGVQGGAEMGAYATAFPGQRPVNPENAAELSTQWGFPVPTHPGMTAPEALAAAGRGELDVLVSSGGNFLDVMPDPDAMRSALASVSVRFHADIVVTPQMFVEGDEVWILPVRTRYEQEGGGTSTTTERRVAFSPELARDVGEARSEWRLYGDIVAAARPDLAEHFSWPTNRDLRAEIARIVPAYAGIEHLERTGDAIQWGGRHLCSGGRFPTPSGRAAVSVVRSTPEDLPAGAFVLSTRRGKQFNSMIWAEVDPLTGASRDAVYMDARDARDRGFANGDLVRVSSEQGAMLGHLHLVDLPRRTVQVHWPEGNVLLSDAPERREPGSKMPDYNAVVRIELADLDA